MPSESDPTANSKPVTAHMEIFDNERVSDTPPTVGEFSPGAAAVSSTAVGETVERPSLPRQLKTLGSNAIRAILTTPPSEYTRNFPF